MATHGLRALAFSFRRGACALERAGFRSRQGGSMQTQSFESTTNPFLMAMTTACVRALAFSFRSMDVM